MDLEKVMQVSVAGMDVQGIRLKTIAENMANVNSTATTPGGDPYRRKLVTFKDALDTASGQNLVKIDKITYDKSDFPTQYNPGHPDADAQGYVKMPNVNTLVEAMDMREAQRSYEANLNMVNVSKTMLLGTIGLLKN